MDPMPPVSPDVNHAATTQQQVPQEEGYLHFMAREGRTVLRWVGAISLVLTVATMVSPMWMAAIIPAAIMIVSYVLLILTNEVERRSDVTAHDRLEQAETAMDRDVIDDHAEDDQLSEVPTTIIKRESKMGFIVLACLLVVALIFAFIKLPWEVFAIGTFVVFCYMIFIMAPVWLGWFENDIDLEQHRLENKPEPAQVRTS